MSSSIDTANLDTLKEVIGYDLKEILQSFINLAPDMLYKIESSLHNQDASALQLHAHTLKGSSANVGAIILPNIALTLEQHGKSGNTQGLEKNFKALELENKKVIESLKNYIYNFLHLIN